MQFIPLPNYYKMLKAATTKTTLSFTDITNTSRTLYQPWTYTNSSNATTFTNLSPFYTDKSSNYTAATALLLYVRAASDTTPQDYVPSSQVGTCTVSVSENSGSNGWTMTIKVAGTAGGEINTLYFSRKLWWGGNGGENNEAVIFALKLDNTVTIDSTGEANFVFRLELT